MSNTRKVIIKRKCINRGGDAGAEVPSEYHFSCNWLKPKSMKEEFDLQCGSDVWPQIRNIQFWHFHDLLKTNKEINCWTSCVALVAVSVARNQCNTSVDTTPVTTLLFWYQVEHWTIELDITTVLCVMSYEPGGGGMVGAAVPPVSEIFGQNAHNLGNKETIKDGIKKI